MVISYHMYCNGIGANLQPKDKIEDICIHTKENRELLKQKAHLLPFSLESLFQFSCDWKNESWDETMRCDLPLWRLSPVTQFKMKEIHFCQTYALLSSHFLSSQTVPSSIPLKISLDFLYSSSFWWFQLFYIIFPVSPNYIFHLFVHTEPCKNLLLLRISSFKFSSVEKRTNKVIKDEHLFM